MSNLNDMPSIDTVNQMFDELYRGTKSKKTLKRQARIIRQNELNEKGEHENDF